MVEFLWLPCVAGLLIASTAGALGTFVVWRRMSYYGDTLAHASLLGVAVGFAGQVNLQLALTLSCVVVAVLLVSLQRNSAISTDTLLGIIAHSSLSIALVSISFMDSLRIDLMAYLFGDLLSISAKDLIWIAVGALLTALVLARFWRAFLAVTIDADMAKVDGYPVERLNFMLMIIVALTIALAMKFVGALLITSLMIIPAATARAFAKTPEQMAALASLIGSLAVLLGIALSWYQDTPAGPSVVVAAALLFFTTQLRRRLG